MDNMATVAAQSPDIWGQLVGPAAGLVLALVALGLLWKKLSKTDELAIGRETALIARVEKIEDETRNRLSLILEQNASAFTDLANAQRESIAANKELADAIRDIPCLKSS